MDGLMDYDVMCVWAEGADKGLNGTQQHKQAAAVAAAEAEADDPRPTKQEDNDEAAAKKQEQYVAGAAANAIAMGEARGGPAIYIKTKIIKKKIRKYNKFNITD